MTTTTGPAAREERDVSEQYEVVWVESDGECGQQDYRIGLFATEAEAESFAARFIPADVAPSHECGVWFGIVAAVDDVGPAAKWAIDMYWFADKWVRRITQIRPTDAEIFSDYHHRSPGSRIYEAHLYAPTRAAAIKRFDAHFGVTFEDDEGSASRQPDTHNVSPISLTFCPPQPIDINVNHMYAHVDNFAAQSGGTSLEPRPKATIPTTLRLDEVTRERVRLAAIKHYQGNESILLREAITTYLDLRDTQGLDFDRVIQPMRGRELVVVS